MRIVSSLLLVAALCACATFQQLVALRQVDFALTGVQNGRLAGVALDRIASYEDLSFGEIARLGLALTRDDLPLTFQVNLRAENPSDNAAAATLVRLAWTLSLDERETISGVLDRSYAIPSGGSVQIPLDMSLNLREFFDGGAESMVNLAADVAGLGNDPTLISLRAIPTIDTPLGPISYPSPITIVSQSVGGES
jgi:hypothetical protein